MQPGETLTGGSQPLEQFDLSFFAHVLMVGGRLAGKTVELVTAGQAQPNLTFLL